ncbi:MAG: helicase-related protein [Bacillota bacterium]|nr:helicase-related protein [Bacillota bacterium]
MCRPSRGIDVDDVDAVFNFEVPEENEYYIHRIGRTGRAKRHGVAYTLLSDFPSRMRLSDIERNTRSQIITATVDDEGHVTEKKYQIKKA